jgi:hypothetical protein
MLVGATGQSLGGNDFAALNASAGPFSCRRSYNGSADFSTNGGVPTSFTASNAAYDYDVVADVSKYVSIYSSKPDLTRMGSSNTGTNLDDEVNNFLASIPEDHPMLLTIWHEADGKVRSGTFTLTVWKAAFKRFCDLVHAFGNPDLYTALVLEAYQPTTAGTLYADMWPGDGYADCLLTDGYTDLGSGDGVWKKGVDFAALKGIPWGIAELGFRTGTVTSDWMAVQATYAEDHDGVCLCWFNSNSGGVTPTPGTAAGPLATARLASTAYYVQPNLFVL